MFKNPRVFRIEVLLKRYHKMKDQLKTMEYKNVKYMLNDLDQFLFLEKEIEVQAAYLEHEGENL